MRTENPRVPSTISMPLLGAAVLFCCSLMSVPLLHLMPLIRACGVPAAEAGGPLLVMLFAAIAGRLAFGRLADMIGALPAYLVASGWQTVLVVGFTQLGGLGSFYIFAPIYGFGYGGVMTCLLAAVRDFAPFRNRSGATGIVLAFAWAGHGLGGYLGGVLFDITLNYEVAFLLASAAGCANLLILSVLWVVSKRQAGEGATGLARPV